MAAGSCSAPRLALAALLVPLAVLSLGSSAAAGNTRATAQIYFYANVGSPIGVNNPPKVMPSTLVIGQDGSWLIVELRWSGWGASVAMATGVGVSTRQGRVVKRQAARLELSQPSQFHGRQVYSCFKLTTPATPAANLDECIGRSGSLDAYQPRKAAAPASASASQVFRFQTPSGNIFCELHDNGTAESGAGCQMRSPQAQAGVNASGEVSICQHRAPNVCAGNFGEGPAFRRLAYGSAKTLGRFHCSSEASGVTCALNSSGKGFFISRQAVRRVG